MTSPTDPMMTSLVALVTRIFVCALATTPLSALVATGSESVQAKVSLSVWVAKVSLDVLENWFSALSLAALAALFGLVNDLEETDWQ